MKVVVKNGWIIFESAFGTKWQIRLDDVTAMASSVRGDLYLKIWLKNVSRPIKFLKGVTDEDSFDYGVCGELEKIIGDSIRRG